MKTVRFPLHVDLNPYRVFYISFSYDDSKYISDIWLKHIIDLHAKMIFYAKIPGESL